jgi:transcriptional regulator with XRE-family HTH domain
VLTQQQLADAAKLHRVTIARLEEGRQRPTVGKRLEDRAGVALARVPRNSAGLAAGDNRGHSLGGEGEQGLAERGGMGRQLRGWGAFCQAAARRLREIGDVVIVQDPEAGLGVENLYQVRQHKRRLRAHVHDEPTGRDRRSASPTP